MLFPRTLDADFVVDDLPAADDFVVDLSLAAEAVREFPPALLPDAEEAVSLEADPPAPCFALPAPEDPVSPFFFDDIPFLMDICGLLGNTNRLHTYVAERISELQA
jgi:hypothetical protein